MSWLVFAILLAAPDIKPFTAQRCINQEQKCITQCVRHPIGSEAYKQCVMHCEDHRRHCSRYQ